MTDALVIPVPSALSETPRLRDALARFCEEHGVPSRVGLHVQLAVEEVVVNVIEHGYRHDPGRVIEVRLDVIDGTLTATVVDDAAPFDPLQVAAPDVGAALATREAGGVGILLARRLMYGVVYRREGDRNILVLTKRVA